MWLLLGSKTRVGRDVGLRRAAAASIGTDDIAVNGLYARQPAGLVETVVFDDSYQMVMLDRQRGLVAERSVSFAAGLSTRVGDAEVASPQRVGPAELRGGHVMQRC